MQRDGLLTKVVDGRGTSIWVASGSRLYLYSRGVNKRIETLVEEYRISSDMFQKHGVLVDVGANIGELGIWAKGLGLRYLGLEPDPQVYEALQRNVGVESSRPFAAGSFDGEAQFFLATGSADSSLIRPVGGNYTRQVAVTLRKLDSLLEELLPVGLVDVLKIEAEGSEPEVLQGARKVLQRVRWCAVDAGPERLGESTIPQVANFLYGQGFQLTFRHSHRQTYVFQNRNL